MKAIYVGLLLGMCACALAQSDSVFEFKGEGILMTPAEAIPVRGRIKTFVWNRDGTWLYIHSQVLPPGDQIRSAMSNPKTATEIRATDVHSVWSPKTGKVRELLSRSVDRPMDCDWDPYNQCLFGWSDEPNKGSTLFRWDIGTWTGSTVVVAPPERSFGNAGGYITLDSPDDSEVVAAYNSVTRRFFDLKIPTGYTPVREPAAMQGKIVLEKIEAGLTVAILDTQTGELSRDLPRTDNLFYAQPEPEWNLRQVSKSTDRNLNFQTTFGRSNGPLGEFELVAGPSEDRETPSLVKVGFTDGQASLNVKATHVVFECQGALLRREFVRVPMEVLRTAKEAAAKMEAMSASKQAALAIIMYSSDADDKMPEKDNFYQQTLPYIKSEDMLARFVYTYSGPASSLDIKEPATTEIGYIPGPGGRAVAYADGHVKWIPDRK